VAGNTVRVITSTSLCIGSQLLLLHTGGFHGDLSTGKYVRVAVLIDGRTLTTRARVTLGASPTVVAYSKNIKGQVRQGSKEIITVKRAVPAGAHVPETGPHRQFPTHTRASDLRL